LTNTRKFEYQGQNKNSDDKKKEVGEGHKVKYNLQVCSATHGEMGGEGRQKLSVALYNSLHLVFGWLSVSYLDIKKKYILKVLQSGAGEGSRRSV